MTQLTNRTDRIAAAVIAGLIYDAVNDEFNMANVQHLAKLTTRQIDAVTNRMLVIANRLDDQSGLPERRAEWAGELQK